MRPVPARKDLVVLAADKNIEFTLRGLLLNRTPALAIRRVMFDVFAHPEHDPACLRKAHEFLRVSLNTHDQALVVFDRVGCGKEDATPVALEREVEERLAAVDRALYQARKPRSSALYQRLAEQVGFSSCADRAFGKLLATLRAWFGT